MSWIDSIVRKGTQRCTYSISNFEPTVANFVLHSYPHVSMLYVLLAYMLFTMQLLLSVLPYICLNVCHNNTCPCECKISMCAPCLSYLKIDPVLLNCLLHLQWLLFPLQHPHLQQRCLLTNWPNGAGMNDCNMINNSVCLHPNLDLDHQPSWLNN